MTAHPVFRILHRTLDVFERARVECAVTGGIAVGHWALPRPAFDADFAVAVEGEPLVRLLRAFEEAGFTVDPQFLAGFTVRARLTGQRGPPDPLVFPRRSATAAGPGAASR